jgi:hypothetical protein
MSSKSIEHGTQPWSRTRNCSKASIVNANKKTLRYGLSTTTKKMSLKSQKMRERLSEPNAMNSDKVISQALKHSDSDNI